MVSSGRRVEQSRLQNQEKGRGGREYERRELGAVSHAKEVRLTRDVVIN